MKIALIAGGRLPIPAKDWGAIENIIWNYKKYLEKLGHKVDIYNSTWIHEVVYEINHKKYDFIHLHWDLFTLTCNHHLNTPFCLTSHCGGFSKFNPRGKYYPAFNYLFKDSLLSPGNIVLSTEIGKLYNQAGYKKFLRVLRNPVETARFKTKSKGNGKALYLGRIYPRKRQAWLSKLLKNEKVKIDFVGPWDKSLEPEFNESDNLKYLGVWSREMVYKNLTDYNCLILLSESEAAPLVVLEGLAAGLSVVVNKASSANLTNEKFITILDDGENNPQVIAKTINNAIEVNEQYRKEIREYAVERFDYAVVIKEYIKIIEEFKEYYK